ncbi:hypothetical protein [uncultured Dysosmobacter sp.]|uniref:hypothetical protein n=1 Tax=uncultured Dysosmobacter sp. TaxID=2591384 RepID=UPI0026064531|nr:hypothetical protein [uncultured Dysosmobacter sp.]
MPHIADTRGILRENLSDAGCDLEMIEQFMTLVEQGNREEGLALLAKHRKRLLDCCHAEQKKLDCLDYLVYQMNKQGKKPSRF